MGDSRRILVVEDDAEVRDLLDLLLADQGYEVATASDGAAALALVLDGGPPPRVILLDLMMPVMDGYTFAQRYHESPGPHAPIVVVSAHDGTPYADLIGAAAVLRKPFAIDELFDTVERCATDPTAA